MSSLLHMWIGMLFRRGADHVAPRFERRWPRTYHAYEVAGRVAAIGLLVLLALFAVIGPIAWVVSQ